MLSDEVLEKVVERLARRMEQANTYIIEQIGKSIKKIGTLSPTKRHELIQIMQYGGDYDKILHKLKQVTKINIKDLKKIFEEVAESDYRFSEQFYKYRNKKFIKWEENQPLKSIANVFEKQTAKELLNLTNPNNLAFGWVNNDGSIRYKSLKKAYIDLLDEAVLNVAQGKETFDSAMYRQLKEIGSGIKVVTTYTDKDGKKHTRATRVDSVLRTQMKDALRNMHNEMQREVGKQFDADGVEVSVHLNPAPDHELVQGRQFSNKQFDNFQNDKTATSYDGVEFPSVSEETGHDRRSISQYNCYHYVFSIILGVSKPAYSNVELQKIINDSHKKITFEGKEYTMYEATQLQRKLEYEIREAKDEKIMGNASNDLLLINKSKKKIAEKTQSYKELSKISGLPTKINRLKIAGKDLYTKDELASINTYISSNSLSLNEKLRTGQELTNNEEKIVKNLDTALEKTPNYNGDIVRTMEVVELEKYIKKIEKAKDTGKTYSENQYLSFSTGVKHNKNPNVVINIYNSELGKDFTVINKIGENEVLYPRNQEFFVKSIIKKDGIYYVIFEEKK